MALDAVDSAPFLSSRWEVGCPGCRIQKKIVACDGALPKKELSFVAVISLCNALPSASLFPFTYFMVEDFKIAKSDTMIATYAGYLGSAMMLGRFISSAFWGIIADRCGRKPVILIGTASIIIFNTLFGFSTNFWMALITRFLLGICNGMLSAMRAYASEICGKENQAWGLSMLGSSWAVGLIVGPAIGGYLAQPSQKYPTIFPKGSLFDRFPYALPCLCISSFAVLALISGFLMPESFHNHHMRGIANVVATHKSLKGETANSKTEKLEANTMLVSDSERAGQEALWKNMGTLIAMYIYCIWGLHTMAYSEIFSWWAVSPKSYGGLEFSTNEVADVLTIAGVALFVFQFFVTARLTKLFGAVRVVQIPAILTVILTAVHPLIAKLDEVPLWSAIILSQILKRLLSACVTVGSSVLMNNSVASGQRGALNGISTSIMSLFKAIGPTIAGFIFSSGQARINSSFLPGMWMVFGVLSIFALVAVIPSFEPLLPKSLEKSQPEDLL
ncbi:hypothetical protein KP509_13G043600 [Ceratopteris richardii]|uniref:Major facilitator superfamily (MFS) profile domain-containing protein n=1 Tax=Ceratopteris richardii TaxID=49495 RepID=A0A8T2THB0_CERRI|nr:hypothetical protein KP509_13G043600 [Ceratopteris richardii]